MTNIRISDTRLQHYEHYCVDINTNILPATLNLADFNTIIKKRRRLILAKKQARESLQRIYALVATNFDLPGIPVYLSDKYKISLKGLAFSKATFPKSIVLFLE